MAADRPRHFNDRDDLFLSTPTAAYGASGATEVNVLSLITVLSFLRLITSNIVALFRRLTARRAR